MRTLTVVSLTALLCTSGAAASSITQCRAISDNTARLDCYDSIAAVDGAPLAATPAPQATASRFDGAYIGASAHFGSANESLYSRGWTEDHNFRFTAPSMGVFAGYNQPVGNMVLGVEASLRGDVASTGALHAEENWSTTLPQLRYSWWGGYDLTRGTGTRFENSGPFTTATAFERSDTVRELLSPMLSARAGTGFGNFLLYGRAGIGASYMSNRISETATETTCTDTISQIDYTPWSESATYISCIDPVMSSTTETTKRNRLAPTFAAAIGVEYHHDSYFGRVEAEARYIHWGNTFLPSGDNGTMRYQVGFGAGIKF